MNKFLSKFNIEWAKLELNNLNCLVEEFEWKNDIYFLWWVFEFKEWRASDKDIVLKNYFVIDFDLYNNCKKLMWVELDTESIISEAGVIKWLLDKNEYFKERSFINFSWRWIHLFYICDSPLVVWEDIEYDVYSYWVQRIYRELEEYLWEPYYKPDYACRNISRIMRVPWSINSKNWEVCRTLYKQDSSSRLVQLLPKLWFKEKQEEQEKERIKKEAYMKEYEEKIKKMWFSEKDVYNEINKKVPAWFLATEITWFKLNKNWKNFDNEKWWYCWFWYDKELNIIHNWGSQNRFLNKNWYDPFQIVKERKNYNNREVFLYFKNRFKIN